MPQKQLKKIDTTIVIAIIGLISVIITAYFGYIGNKLQAESSPINATATANAKLLDVPKQNSWIEGIPMAGAQLDFTPKVSKDKIELYLNMKSSPYSGMFLSEINFERPPTSYGVKYKDGSYFPAESKNCFINTGYPLELQSPLNLRASDISFEIAVFVDERYSVTINDIDLIIEHIPPPTDIEFIGILQPGAGGMGLPFQTVRVEKSIVDENIESMNIDFRDFDLQAQQGVSFFIPVFLVDDGTYIIQVKVNLLAHPVYEGDYSGKASLTSGKMKYSWASIDDPQNYELVQEEIYPGVYEGKQPSLVDCP